MKRDFDYEEFLQRLDIRIYALSGLIEYHEKYIAAMILDRNKFLCEQKRIERTRKDFLDFTIKADKEISECFSRVSQRESQNADVLPQVLQDELREAVSKIFNIPKELLQ